MTIYMFTDGSTIYNGTSYARGGYAVFFGDDDPRNYAAEMDGPNVTNQRCELMAAIKACEQLILSEGYNYIKVMKAGTAATRFVKKKAIIFSDSEYVINCATKFIPVWKRRGWIKADKKPVLNVDLVSILGHLWDICLKFLDLRIIHTKAHREPPKDKKSLGYFVWYGNYNADRMAKGSYLNAPKRTPLIRKKGGTSGRKRSSRALKGGI